jgi:hypothetical protein
MQLFIISEYNQFTSKIIFIATSKRGAIAKLKRLYGLSKEEIEHIFQYGNHNEFDYSIQLSICKANTLYGGLSAKSRISEIATLKPSEIFHKAAAGELHGVLHFKNGVKVGSGIIHIDSDENGKCIYFAQEMYSERKYIMQESEFVKFVPID